MMRTHVSIVAIVLAIAAAVGAGAPVALHAQGPPGAGGVARPGPPPREATPGVPTGTAVLGGQVTTSPAGTPIRHAQVILIGSDPPVRRSTTTDAEGRYRFAALPGGRYVVTANKAGFVAFQYGQRRPLESGTPVLVADGQTIETVNVALPRGSVISGRVIDDVGEPVARATVQALRYSYGADGQRRLQVNSTATTDDLGQFRVFGLMPGDYVVSASYSDPVLAGFSLADAGESYLTSYYPGTPNIGEAQPVTLTVGQEATVQFALGTGRLSRVAGIVVDSTGRPFANAILTLAGAAGAYGSTTSAPIAPDGSFSISNVAPGDYVITVQPVARAGDKTPIPEEGLLPITVNGADLLDLRVRTSPGATVTGRVVFEGGAPHPNGLLRVIAQSAEPFQVAQSVGVDTGLVAEDGTFELKGVRGPVLFRTGSGAVWALKSVSVAGDDVTDVPTDLTGRAELGGVTIVLTDRLTDVSGQVLDSRGGLVKDYVVVVQPAEPKSDAALARYLRVIRPDQDGRFRARGLPPGQYDATAVESLEQGRQFVPDVRARLRDGARRIALGEGATVTIDLRLTPGIE